MLESPCLLDLLKRAKHEESERWNEANRPDSQAGQTNKYHPVLVA
jgi:hypothetical protein